ncbi:MAG: DUF1294 domain-containing protein [Lachnospiraceae bacterium]|nr:DUF1294 domain-containing protein [Lachnospiraceae bacterium]
MKPLVIAVITWLCVANLGALILFGADKKRAKEGRWRIPEKTLFLSAILGGSIGAILGMHLFRHKTKHWYFRYGLPAILLVQIGLGLWLSGVLG